MKFTGRDPWYRDSVDGQWRIAKVTIEQGARFEVWKKSREGWLLVKANLISYEEAQQFCRLEVFGQAQIDTTDTRRIA